MGIVIQNLAPLINEGGKEQNKRAGTRPALQTIYQYFFFSTKYAPQ